VAASGRTPYTVAAAMAARGAGTPVIAIVAAPVHDDLMIDVLPRNDKLRDRLAGIVAEIAHCETQAAADALARCDGNGQAAVLHLLLGLDPADALHRAGAHASLRSALLS
jgi:N-acetylmuramic acid 6-phosphate (MurNAc-6-P) etherase